MKIEGNVQSWSLTPGIPKPGDFMEIRGECLSWGTHITVLNDSPSHMCINVRAKLMGPQWLVRLATWLGIHVSLRCSWDKPPEGEKP